MDPIKEKRILELVAKAWRRGANWALKGRGYAMDSDALSQYEEIVEIFREKKVESFRVESKNFWKAFVTGFTIGRFVGFFKLTISKK